MKRLFAKCLFFIYLLSFSGMKEIMKFPLLIEHFVEHRAEDYQMSIYDFMDMHYFSNHEVDADYDKDIQLPFKSFENHHNFWQVFPAKTCWEIHHFVIDVDKHHHFFYVEDIPHSHLDSIFRPPQDI